METQTPTLRRMNGNFYLATCKEDRFLSQKDMSCVVSLLTSWYNHFAYSVTRANKGSSTKLLRLFK
jgi:hypothetical protein